MGGGGGSTACTRSATGSFHNYAAPPRLGGKYKTTPQEPAIGVQVRETAVPATGTKGCDADYYWDSKGSGSGCTGKGSKCAPPKPYVEYCPKIGGQDIGQVTQTDWSGKQVVCSYNSVSIPLDQLSKYFDPTTVNSISADRCGALDYNALSLSSECQKFYGAELDSELLKRIEAIPGWSGNAPLMTFVNSKLKAANAKVSDQQRAVALVQKNCDANPMDAKCGCYNVTKFGNGCLNDENKKKYPGCKELAKAMSDLPAAAQIGTMNMFCASNECSNAKASDESLLPGPNPPVCNMNIAQCVNDFRNANLTGSPVTAECKNTITGVTVPPPPPPAGTTVAAPGGTATGGSSAAAAPAAAGAAAGGVAAGVATSAAPESKKGLIIGLSVGGFLLLLSICAIVLFFIMKKKGK